MILTCPKCLTQYLLSASALVPDGRKVRCSQCQHTWFQEALGDAVEEELSPFPSAQEMAAPVQLPTVQRKISAPIAVKLGAIAALLLALIASVFAFRNTVIETVPATAGLYKALSYYPTAGLTLEGMELTITEQEDGKKTIALSGRIYNGAPQPRMLPRVMIKLLNAEGDILSKLDYSQKLLEKGNPGIIQPQEQVHMDPRINNIPDVVKKLVIDVGNPVELAVR